MSGGPKKKGKLIEEGTVIVTDSGAKVTVNYLISDSGGQGDVYHASFRGKDYALKWYCKNEEDIFGGRQHQGISAICGEQNDPSPQLFIWPLIMVTEETTNPVKRFGYLMNLIPSGFAEMDNYLKMDEDDHAVRFASYNAMLTAGMNIAAAMQKLHLKGFAYKDLNPKNIAINPNTGDVLIVDNDNVTVNGTASTVSGMKGYMAPEIPASKYRVNPTRETDYYSLAVVLYRLFFIDHPMEGKLWEKVPMCTDEVEEYLYSIKPVFHFDPNDDSNRPTDVFAPNVTSRWSQFPVELRKLFVRSFTEGIRNPSKRAPEGEWIGMLSKCREKLINLGNGREQFVRFDNPKTVPPFCLGMKIGATTVALYPGKAIYQISIDGNVKQYGTRAAGILFDKNQKCLKIKNLSDTPWRGWSPKTKQTIDIPAGGEYPLEKGNMIEFQRAHPQIVGEVF